MGELELVAPTTDGGDRQTADEGVQVPPGDRLDSGRTSACTPNSPSAEGPAGVAATASAGPYDPAELEALIEAVWSLEGDADPTRFDELLHAALVSLGRIALNPFAAERGMVTLLLRSMEQRALWGPDHPVRQP